MNPTLDEKSKTAVTQTDFLVGKPAEHYSGLQDCVKGRLMMLSGFDEKMRDSP